MGPQVNTPTLTAPVTQRRRRDLPGKKKGQKELWVRFFGRIQKRICDLRSYGFFTIKKTEDPKKDHLPLTACPRAPRGEKKQQNDPHGENKKKKQHKLLMNIRNVYISDCNTNVSRTEYTP